MGKDGLSKEVLGKSWAYWIIPALALTVIQPTTALKMTTKRSANPDETSRLESKGKCSAITSTERKIIVIRTPPKSPGPY